MWKAFDKVWHAGLFHKLKPSGISGEIFGHISSFLSKRQLQVDLDGKTHKNIELMLEFLNVLFLILYFNDLPDVICDIAIYDDDITLYCK